MEIAILWAQVLVFHTNDPTALIVALVQRSVVGRAAVCASLPTDGYLNYFILNVNTSLYGISLFLYLISIYLVLILVVHLIDL
jgi:hypothetical protein